MESLLALRNGTESLLALRNGTVYDQLKIPIAILTVIVSLLVVYFVFRILGRKPLVDTEARMMELGITKINDSVYELISPAPNQQHTVDIIFFHGLQRGDYKNAFWSTWMSLKGDVLWPIDWLSKDIPGARILSVSYDACGEVTAETGREDMYIIGENFVQDLILNNMEPGVGQNCPVILVGHSLGGLVIKELILSASKRKNVLAHDPEDIRDNAQLNKLETFLDNACGVFYYATPHGGSQLADLAVRILPGRSSLLHFLTVLKKEKARLNSEFSRWRRAEKLRTYGVAEAFKTRKGWFFSALVVPEASMRVDTDDVITVRADHINVCKPESKSSSAYQSLRDFTLNVVPTEVSKLIKKQLEDAIIV